MVFLTDPVAMAGFYNTLNFNDNNYFPGIRGC